jgi:hypothetical protein
MSLRIRGRNENQDVKKFVEKIIKSGQSMTVIDLRQELKKITNLSEEKICDRYRLKTGVYSHRAIGEYTANTGDSIILNRKTHNDYSSCSEACGDLIKPTDEMNLSLDGSGEHTNVLVSDSAYGQSTNDFDRFVTLGDKENQKRPFEFLHGCRGKGHLVSLNSCEFKIVLSSTPDSDCWTVTFMYKYEDEYYFVKDGDEFITFTGELECGGEIGKKSKGTVFYHMDYDIRYKGGKMTGFRRFVRRFSHGVVNPFLPIKINDRRKENAKFVYSGLRDYIKNNESVFEFLGQSSVTTQIGEMEVLAAVPKDDLNREQKRVVHRVVSTSEDSIILSVDGQSHYKASNSILTSRLDLDEIGNKTILLCRLKSENASELFNDDRNSFENESAENSFETGVVKAVEDMEELDAINTDRVVAPKDGFSGESKRRLDELNDNVDLREKIDAEELHPIHNKYMNHVSELKNAPIVEKLLDENENTNIFEEIIEILNSGQVYVDRRSIKEGKEVDQAGKSAVGQIFEILCYTRLVELCENSNYVCYYNPTVEEIPGCVGGDYSQEPDMDIVIVDESEQNSPVYVFSLKTSLKERIKQSAYWRLKMKIPSTKQLLRNPRAAMKNLLETTMFKSKSRPIRYGYLSPVWNGGSSSSVLNDFDFGFVPDKEVSDDIDHQFKMSRLRVRSKSGKRIDSPTQ